MSAAELLPVCRFIYRGESLRNGRVVQLDASAVAWQGDDERPVILGHHLLKALEEDEANVDLARFAPFVYSKALEGWSPLRPDTAVQLHRTEHEVRRAEVMLELRQPAPVVPPGADACSLATAVTVAAAAVGGSGAADGGALVPGGASDGGATAPLTAAAAGSSSPDEGGFFGIGIFNSKSAENVGTLWRSAYQLGASWIFTIGERNGWEKTADTMKAWRQIPAFRFTNWGAFCASSPYATAWVAVEMGGTPLEEFEHPERCVYVLGAEDQGLPAAVIRACSHCVSLGASRADKDSYNVAVAGSLVLYDRLQKQRARAKRAAQGLAEREALAQAPAPVQALALRARAQALQAQATHAQALEALARAEAAELQSALQHAETEAQHEWGVHARQAEAEKAEARETLALEAQAQVLAAADTTRAGAAPPRTPAPAAT